MAKEKTTKKVSKKPTTDKLKDIKDLEKRIEKLKKHLEKNKHDYKTKRTLQIKEAKLRKLKIYRAKKSK